MIVEAKATRIDAYRSDQQNQAVLSAAAHRKRLGKEQSHQHQMEGDVAPSAPAQPPSHDRPANRETALAGWRKRSTLPTIAG